MSDDIMKRLRRWARVAGDVCPPAGKCMMEAAREIERLRWERMGAIVFGVAFGVAAIATAALFCSLMAIKG